MVYVFFFFHFGALRYIILTFALRNCENMNRITTYIRQSLQDIYPPEEAKALSMLICCDMLGLDALDIYMGKDIILSACKQRELENIIFRLQKNEPIQYIRGYAEFCGGSRAFVPCLILSGSCS